jgi:predicted ATP-dependent endonuclease of OLD family
MELHFDPKCRILVGINESGKTNILDALNLLDKSEIASSNFPAYHITFMWPM